MWHQCTSGYYYANGQQRLYLSSSASSAFVVSCIVVSLSIDVARSISHILRTADSKNSEISSGSWEFLLHRLSVIVWPLIEKSAGGLLLFLLISFSYFSVGKSRKTCQLPITLQRSKTAAWPWQAGHGRWVLMGFYLFLGRSKLQERILS